MACLRTRLAVLLPLAGILLAAAPAEAGSADAKKGAQVYCYMRSNGNGHAVSFEASYALIKRQSSGLFKTSPTHAAVMKARDADVKRTMFLMTVGRFGRSPRPRFSRRFVRCSKQRASVVCLLLFVCVLV